MVVAVRQLNRSELSVQHADHIEPASSRHFGAGQTGGSSRADDVLGKKADADLTLDLGAFKCWLASRMRSQSLLLIAFTSAVIRTLENKVCAGPHTCAASRRRCDASGAAASVAIGALLTHFPR